MTQKKSDVARRVEEDHKSINQEVQKLKISMKKEFEPEDFSNWRLEFIWQLRDFKNRLLKHFDLEEEGGFMRDVLNVAPHSAGKVNQLKDEHDQIILDLDDILAKLKSMQEKDLSELENIRTSLNEIISDLRKHENEEHILLQRAYYREFGGAD